MAIQGFPTSQEMQQAFAQFGFNERQTQGLTTFLERISNVAQQNIVQAQERITTLEQENIQLIGRVQQLEQTSDNTLKAIQDGFQILDQKIDQKFDALQGEMNHRFNGLEAVLQQILTNQNRPQAPLQGEKADL